MNRLLKIVGGPLKGAEIALVEGTRVSVGSGDACDILVADATLGKVAFELDVTPDEVTLTTPDGAAKTLLDFEVREFGASAFAIGPAEGAWQPVVWPERPVENAPAANAPSAAPGDSAASGPVEDKGADKAEGDGEMRKESHGAFGCLAWLVVFLVLVAAIAWLLWRYREHPRVVSAREQAVAVWRGWFPDREAEARRIEAAKPTLDEIAAKYALEFVEVDGKPVIVGDFRTRAERLQAAAEVYSVRPGAELDFADDESLVSGADDLLKLVTEGRITVVSASNRVVTLQGYAATVEALRATLVALNADVPGIARADCTRVTCGSGAGEAMDNEEFPIVTDSPHRPRRRKSAVSPNLPVCGILTTPYPCLILKNGSRLLEGGEFGGCIIERISPDAVTLRNASGSFEWRP